MMTCKNCLYFNMCYVLADNPEEAEVEGAETDCSSFADRSRYVVREKGEQRKEQANTVNAVVLPCQRGQTIYRVKNREKVISTYTAEGFLYDGAFWKVRATELIPSWIGNQKKHWYISFSSFGKTVFLTRAEAEVALAEMTAKEQT